MRLLAFLIPLACFAQTDLPGPVSALPAPDHSTNNGVCSWNKTQTFKSCVIADPVLAANFTLTPQNANYVLAGTNIAQTFSANQTFTANLIAGTTGLNIGAGTNPFARIRAQVLETNNLLTGAGYTLESVTFMGRNNFAIKNPVSTTVFQYEVPGTGNPLFELLGDVVPWTTNTYDFGSTGNRWNKAWAKDLDLSGNIVLAGTETITGCGAGTFVKADGTGCGTAGGTGTVTSISTTSPITGGTITTTGTIACATCVTTNTTQTISATKTFSANQIMSADLTTGTDDTFNLGGTAHPFSAVAVNNLFTCSVTTHACWKIVSNPFIGNNRVQIQDPAGTVLLAIDQTTSPAKTYLTSDLVPVGTVKVGNSSFPWNDVYSDTVHIGTLIGGGTQCVDADNVGQVGRADLYTGNGECITTGGTQTLSGNKTFSGSNTFSSTNTVTGNFSVTSGSVTVGSSGNFYTRPIAGNGISCSGVTDGWLAWNTSGQEILMCAGGNRYKVALTSY